MIKYLSVKSIESSLVASEILPRGLSSASSPWERSKTRLPASLCVLVICYVNHQRTFRKPFRIGEGLFSSFQYLSPPLQRMWGEKALPLSRLTGLRTWGLLFSRTMLSVFPTLWEKSGETGFHFLPESGSFHLSGTQTEVLH